MSQSSAASCPWEAWSRCKCGSGFENKAAGLIVNYFSAVRDLAGVLLKPLQKSTQGTSVSMLMTWAFGLSLAQDFWRLNNQPQSPFYLRDEEVEIFIH